MGSCASTGAEKIHLETNSRLEEAADGNENDSRICRNSFDVKEVFDSYDATGSGLLPVSVFDDLCRDVLGEVLDEEDRGPALKASVGTDGKITFDGFMAWLRRGDSDQEGDEEVLELQYDSMPQSVKAGAKEDGVAQGSDMDLSQAIHSSSASAPGTDLVFTNLRDL